MLGFLLSSDFFISLIFWYCPIKFWTIVKDTTCAATMAIVRALSKKGNSYVIAISFTMANFVMPVSYYKPDLE